VPRPTAVARFRKPAKGGPFGVLFDFTQATMWSCLSFVDTFKLWTEGVYDAEKSPLTAGAAV